MAFIRACECFSVYCKHNPAPDVDIRPFSIHWCPRWDKSESLFYIGRSWQASVWTLDKSKRIELFGLRIQIGPIRILLCTFDLEQS